MSMQTADALDERRALLGEDAASRLVRALDAVVEAAGRLAMALILAMVLVISANVAMRYLFSIGTVAMQELEWHLLVPVAMFGCAYGLRHRAHVRVDLLYERFGPRTRAVVDLLVAVLVTLAAGIVAWLSTGFVVAAWEIGEGSPDPGGLANRWVVKAAVPLGFALIVLQGLAEAIVAAKRLAALGRD
jgi:TRAP-type mannitol/chloroaromatic compound transport system permease small subunit